MLLFSHSFVYLLELKAHPRWIPTAQLPWGCNSRNTWGLCIAEPLCIQFSASSETVKAHLGRLGTKFQK